LDFLFVSFFLKEVIKVQGGGDGGGVLLCQLFLRLQKNSPGGASLLFFLLFFSIFRLGFALIFAGIFGLAFLLVYIKRKDTDKQEIKNRTFKRCF